MLDADKLVLERLALLLGLREHLVHGLGNVDLGHVDAAGHLGEPLEFPVDGELECARGKPHLLDNARNDAVLLAEERRKQVPCLNLVVVEPACHRLRVSHGLARHLC